MGTSQSRWKLYKIKDTWLHQFFCLSDKDQESVPSRVEKNRLNNADLGEKRIVFNDKKDLGNTLSPRCRNIIQSLKRLMVY